MTFTLEVAPEASGKTLLLNALFVDASAVAAELADLPIGSRVSAECEFGGDEHGPGWSRYRAVRILEVLAHGHGSLRERIEAHRARKDFEAALREIDEAGREVFLADVSLLSLRIRTRLDLADESGAVADFGLLLARVDDPAVVDSVFVILSEAARERIGGAVAQWIAGRGIDTGRDPGRTLRTHIPPEAWPEDRVTGNRAILLDRCRSRIAHGNFAGARADAERLLAVAGASHLPLTDVLQVLELMPPGERLHFDPVLVRFLEARAAAPQPEEIRMMELVPVTRWSDGLLRLTIEFRMQHSRVRDRDWHAWIAEARRRESLADLLASVEQRMPAILAALRAHDRVAREERERDIDESTGHRLFRLVALAAPEQLPPPWQFALPAPVLPPADDVRLLVFAARRLAPWVAEAEIDSFESLLAGATRALDAGALTPSLDALVETASDRRVSALHVAAAAYACARALQSGGDLRALLESAFRRIPRVLSLKKGPALPAGARREIVAAIDREIVRLEIAPARTALGAAIPAGAEVIGRGGPGPSFVLLEAGGRLGLVTAPPVRWISGTAEELASAISAPTAQERMRRALEARGLATPGD